MRGSLRGGAIDAWEEQGRPRWDLDETVRQVSIIDRQMESEGKDPAPAFRRARLQSDDYYMRVWVAGCRFHWLRSRKPPVRPGIEYVPRESRTALAAVREGGAGFSDTLVQLDALKTPMYVTERGEPRAVLVKYEDYLALIGRLEDLEDALAMQQALASPDEEALTLDEYEHRRAASLPR